MYDQTSVGKSGLVDRDGAPVGEGDFQGLLFNIVHLAFESHPITSLVEAACND